MTKLIEEKQANRRLGEKLFASKTEKEKTEYEGDYGEASKRACDPKAQAAEKAYQDLHRGGIAGPHQIILSPISGPQPSTPPQASVPQSAPAAPSAHQRAPMPAAALPSKSDVDRMRGAVAEAAKTMAAIFGISISGFEKFGNIAATHESRLQQVERNISNLEGRVKELRNH